MIAGLAAVVAVCLAWRWLDAHYSIPGSRAGSFFAAFAFFVAIWLFCAIGNSGGDEPESVLVAVTFVVGAAMLAGIAFLFMLPGFGRFLVRVEESGWFSNEPFKGNQGVRVRRATVLGILVIGFSGIYTLVSHRWFAPGRDGLSDWFWNVPFTEGTAYIPILSKTHMLGPILLGAALVWFAWRLVNWPTFADFLIATEAEMNKVSWTTRKRLVADTIVVLIAVILLTSFLFAVDIIWFKVLSNPLVDVLHVNLKAEQAKQQEKTQW
jgi:preprotein translocase SecE subunit